MNQIQFDLNNSLSATTTVSTTIYTETTDIEPISNTVINTLSSLTLEDIASHQKQDDKNISVRCLQCEQNFILPESKDDYLGHLFMKHRLVIADVDDIGDLTDYLIYWENEFKKDNHQLQEYCTTILLDQLPDGTLSKNEKYYLLSDILPKDYDIRKKLYSKRLELVLKQYQYERCDRNFKRECLYCRDIIIGLRSNYIQHLYNKHFLQLGKSENLVYIDELIDYVQNKLNNLICIYCEKIFKDRSTLKEHMRKKGHKRINPDIRFYDKFFLENYKIEKPKHIDTIMENTRSNSSKKLSKDINNYKNKIINYNTGKSKQLEKQQQQIKEHHKQQARNNYYNSDDDNNDLDWSDWDGEKIKLKCFFCNEIDSNLNKLKQHMYNIHTFNFDKIIKNLKFYHRIKVVNYIRRQTYILNCIKCNQHYNTINDLHNHMNEMKHYDINIDENDKKLWDRPEYFFPTYEDDGILYLLDDIDNNDENLNINLNIDNDDEISPVIIISEDIKATVNKDAEALSMESFII